MTAFETYWQSQGTCTKIDPDELFVEGAPQNNMKRVCAGCPVKTECLATALDQGIEHGVWGGMTERERRALRRKRPNVESWADVFAQAMARAEEQAAHA